MAQTTGKKEHRGKKEHHVITYLISIVDCMNLQRDKPTV